MISNFDNFMKKVLGIFIIIFISSITLLQAQANFNSNVATGNWSAAGSWTLTSGTDADGIPDADDNITILNTHTITVNTAARTCNNLTINTGGTLQINNQNLNVNGTSAISGTLNDNDNGGTNTFVGKITVNTGGTFSTNNTSPFVFQGGIENNGTFNKTGAGAVTFNTNAQILNGTNLITMNGAITLATVGLTIQTPFTTSGTFTIQGAVTVTNQSTTTIAGNLNGNNAASTWLNDNNSILNYAGANAPMATGVLDADQVGNILNYNLAGNQTIKIADHYHLTTSGNGTKTLNGNIGIGGNLTNSATGLTFTNVTAITIGNDLELSNGTFLCTNNTTDPTITINRNYTQTGGTLNFSSNNGGQTTINLKGNYTQSAGIITVSAVAAPAINSSIILNGTTSQTMAGGGTMTAGIIETNNANGITVSSNVNVFTLRLTNGVISTTSPAVLTVANSATTGIIAGSAFSVTNCIDGALARTLPTGSTTGTYTFPIKKGAGYQNYIEIINPNCTGATVLQAEIFNTDTGGAAGTGLGSLLNNGIYWETKVNSGALNSASILLGIIGLNAFTAKIGQSTTLAGAYSNVGGTVTATTITSSSISFGANNFFAIGTKGSLAAGTYTVGPCGTFAKLTNVAFSLNELTLMGNVIFELCPDYDGTTGEVFPITFNQLDTDGGNPYTATIRPRSDATGRQTSGTSASGSIILLNGVDRLTLDGRPGGTGTAREWTIANNSTAQATLTFINDATNNLFYYLNINGASTGTTNGTVYLSTGLTLGNSNHVFDNCNISSATTNPRNAIFSLGTGGAENQNITIQNCSISNFAVNNGLNTGILLNSNTTNWTISNNSFFQTNNINFGNNTDLSAIYINNNGYFNIQGNFIGGSSAQCNGNWLNNQGVNYTRHRLVWVVASNTTTQSVLQNNTYTNFTINPTSGVYQSPIWVAFYQTGAGNWLVNNNFIGSKSDGTGAVSFSDNGNPAGTSSSRLMAIQVNANIAHTITNNTIQNISSILSGVVTAANRLSFTGIEVFNASTTTQSNVDGNTITNITINTRVPSTSVAFVGISVVAGNVNVGNNNANLIGSTTVANAILVTQTGVAGTSVIGLSYAGSSGTVGNNTISGITSSDASNGYVGLVGMSIGNTASTAFIGVNAKPNLIQNLTVNSNNILSSIQGVLINSNATVRYNEIRNINSTQPPLITGIAILSGNSTVSNNLIHTITNNSTSATATLVGIGHTGVFNTTIQNNSIYNLTSKSTALPNTDLVALAGITSVSAATLNISSNTIYSLVADQASASGTSTAGILISGGMNGSVNGNKIYDIKNQSAGTNTVAAGIVLRNTGSNLTTLNNMMTLGLNADGSSNSNATSFVGIWNNTTSSVTTCTNTYTFFASPAVTPVIIKDLSLVGVDVIPTNSGSLTSTTAIVNYINSFLTNTNITFVAVNATTISAVGQSSNFGTLTYEQPSGTNRTANPVSSACNTIFNNLNIYFNSIHIAGNAASGTYNSYGFLRGDNAGGSITTPVNILNNIFQNIRTGTGSHFGIGNQITATGWATGRTDCSSGINKTVDYNGLYSSNANNYGEWLGAANNFASWKTASQGDDHSTDLATPISTFTDAKTADLHIPNAEIRVNAKGLFISAGADIDIDGMTRRGPDIGADELNNVFVFSGIGGDWNVASTWDLNVVPSHADIVRITDDIFIQNNQTGYFYQLDIQASNVLELQGNAKLYGVWWDGSFVNNGTLNFVANGELHLAGSLEDNGTFNRGAGTALLNVDDFPFPTNLCVLDNYLVDVNNNVNIADFLGTANTNFHNLTILNNGIATIQGTNKQITTNGILDIQGTSQLAISNNTLEIIGTIEPTATGTLTGTTASDLIISGSGTLNGSLKFTTGSQILENISINRSGANNNVVLGTPLEIDDLLTLTSGYLSTSTNLLTITENGNTTAGSDASFVRGPMAKRTNSTASFTFPVGKNNHLGEISIVPATNTSTTYIAEYFQTNPNDLEDTVTPPIEKISELEYWSLSSSNSADAQVTLHWTTYSDVSGTVAEIQDNLRVARLAGSAWEDQMGGASGLPSGGTVTTDLINNFGFFTLSSRVPSIALPSRVLAFTVQKYLTNQTQLTWEVISDIGIIHFEIQKSQNGIDFETFAQVDALSFLNQIAKYKFIDEKSHQGISYYRLKVIEKNNNFFYSNILSINFDNHAWKVYPIPTSDILNIEAIAEENQTLHLKITDIQGRLHLDHKEAIQKGGFSKQLDVNVLPAGNYLLEIQLNQQRKIVKFIKVR